MARGVINALKAQRDERMGERARVAPRLTFFPMRLGPLQTVVMIGLCAEDSYTKRKEEQAVYFLRVPCLREPDRTRQA